ncbi:uncharacterized protein K460DRAFT_354764 [Cucurbitaria berberidis CBS 394.84]|uniref:Uncharacterized protein n=1 Tax=Cucurbitaria berberidis CBS 394.84 TaxID=1168544 RepID=A0A9P4L829_9PLEO|nr:uncharacterized protein K460DRAFT_354764 [Cucurbitaria berberidis CBS 394.84]KAF1844894.1 hypothetical protein K460DRAFT_354764 [Cucurbitaria berberidis CBS 394.84]
MKVSMVFCAAAAAGVGAQDSVSATGAGCEPHGDHWHCPSGVAEPTAPPAVTTPTPAVTTSHSHNDDDDDEHDHPATASTCEPHGDHWHCPSGVAQPTTKPAAVSTTSSVRTTAASGAGAAASSSAAAQQSTNAAAGIAGGEGRLQGGVLAVLVGGVAYFL